MSLKIGTNLDYRGHGFLDSRQGLPDSIEYLRDWDYSEYPVPLGFETCLEGEWYIYKGPDYYDEETGHWERRGTGSGSDYSDAIEKLMNKVFPASFSLRATTTTDNLEGKVVYPSFEWSYTKDNIDVLEKVWINGVLQSGKPKTFTSTQPITSKTTYTVKAESTDGATDQKSLTWTFYKNCYWGTILNPSVLNTSDGLNLSSFGSNNKAKCSGWARTINYDCTGGRYILYVVPLSVFDTTSCKMYIGGLENSDWSYRVFNDKPNELGVLGDYVAIWLNNEQHGSLITVDFIKK